MRINKNNQCQICQFAEIQVMFIYRLIVDDFLPEEKHLGSLKIHFNESNFNNNYKTVQKQLNFEF